MSMSADDLRQEFRKLPSVDALLREPRVAWLVAEYGLAEVTLTVRALQDDVRRAIAAGEWAPAIDQWPDLLGERLADQGQPSLRAVINATGVIVHTNLGRAPLSQPARQALERIARGYSNLEYDLEEGGRGSRYDHARQLICALTSAEDALVVNNNAAAVLLVLTALCSGREILISRGQLVEIGGGFRIPDVLRQSGCTLLEVGTTNRTHIHDYADAISSSTCAILRVHSSNFRQIGFVSQPTLEELAQLAHHPPHPDSEEMLLIDDLGSGTLLDTRIYGLAAEPTVQESVTTGADIVTFSGDKLLGGPQAGLILGSQELIAAIRRHPLTRAMRVDKLTLAALDASLHSYQRGRAPQEIPVWQMIAASKESLHARAQAWQAALADRIASGLWSGESTVGGGSLPGETLPTVLLAVATDKPDQMAARLRSRQIPVVCRIQHDHLLFDPRTVLPSQDSYLTEAINAELPSP